MLSSLFRRIDGWKAIGAYLLAQTAGSYPLVLSALKDLIAHPSDPQSITNAVAQTLLVVGLVHKALKNIGDM